MSLFRMSCAGSAMILAVLLIRALGWSRLPKRTFPVLWEIILLRLLVPFTWRSPTCAYQMVERHLPVVQQPAAIPILPAAEVPAPSLSIPLWTWIWGAGTVLCAGYFTIAYLRCLREFRTALPVEDPAVERWLPPLRRRIVLRQTDCVSAPLTYGLLRPVILLPSRMDWTDKEALRHVLIHESVHIRHFDALTKLLLAAAVSLHWWNPLVWIMHRLANQDLEVSCDEAVVRFLGADSGTDYARTLIHMEEKCNQLFSLYSYFSRPILERRILAIMKWKKTTLPALLAAICLVTGVAAAFATSSEAGKLTPVPGASLTEEEYQLLSALRPEGYRQMTVAQFQNLAWAASDSPEYQALLDHVVADEALYRQRNSQETAAFLFYVLCPLINDRWQSQQFDGSVQREFEAWHTALVEYTLTVTVLDANRVTVGAYEKARENFVSGLQRFLDRQTPDALRSGSLADAVEAECRRLENACGSGSLKLDLAYVLQPVDNAPNASPDQPVDADSGEGERRGFPHGTERDYRSLLALRTPGYQSMSLREFNQTLLDWANEDYERMERVNIDIGLNDFQAALTEEELVFVQWTVCLSGAENGAAVRSSFTGRPEEDPWFGGVQMDRAEADGAWCSLWYQFPYHIKDKDALTVGERDLCVGGFVQAVRQFFRETNLTQLVQMTESDMVERMQGLASFYSTDLLTISIHEDQVQFESDVPHPQD